MEDMAKRAVWLVTRPRFSIFPLHTIENDHCTCGDRSCSSPGKHPIASLARNGVKDATTDRATIEQWWALYPDANIGVACGGASGITVVDIDPDHGGMASWRNLEGKHGSVADTWLSRTGSGGYHYWFQYVEGLKNRVGIVPGLDIRNDHGYVVAPPSLHQSGLRYEWDEDNRPSASFQVTGTMPGWLIKLAGGSTQQHKKAETLPEIISEGGRNAWLASIAGTMRARNMSLEAVEAALLIENRNRCQPPLEDREVERIARSIDRYPAAMAGGMTFGGQRG